MKKPCEKPQDIIKRSYLMESYVKYKPEDLRNIASEMENENISWIEFDCELDLEQGNMESQHEANVRYAKELKKWESWREKEKKYKEKAQERLIREAKKYGLTLIEKP